MWIFEGGAKRLDTNMLLYVIYGVGGLFAVIIVAYFILSKKMGKSEYKQIQN